CRAAAGGPGPILLAGFRSDIQRCMSALDLLLHTPRLEAFGLVVIEAMATGLPVVGSRIGGLPDLIRDGNTGFMAEPEQPASFARSRERLVNDAALRRRMGIEARQVALAEYSRDLYAKRHLELYKRLLRR